jgi:hypothetical protein
MLSLFPTLLDFPLFAYFILRIALAYYFGLIAKARMKKSHAFVAVFEVVVTIMVAVGLYTQGALLALMALLIIESAIDRKENLFDRQSAHMRTILGCIALALMFLGAGAFAFDLPL